MSRGERRRHIFYQSLAHSFEEAYRQNAEEQQVRRLPVLEKSLLAPAVTWLPMLLSWQLWCPCRHRYQRARNVTTRRFLADCSLLRALYSVIFINYFLSIDCDSCTHRGTHYLLCYTFTRIQRVFVTLYFSLQCSVLGCTMSLTACACRL